MLEQAPTLNQSYCLQTKVPTECSAAIGSKVPTVTQTPPIQLNNLKSINQLLHQNQSVT